MTGSSYVITASATLHSWFARNAIPLALYRLDQIWAELQDQSLDEHLDGIGIAVGVLGVDYDITMSAMCQTEPFG
jgi:hypothetical protein